MKYVIYPKIQGVSLLVKRPKTLKLSYEESHKMTDGVEYKLCSICREWFEMNESNFYRNEKNSLDGLSPYCKTCHKNKSSERMYANYDKHLESVNKNDRKPHRIKQAREVSKRRRLEGKQQEYYKENPEKMRKYRIKRETEKQHTISDTEWKSCKGYFNYMCAYCGITETEVKRKYKKRLARDHVVNDGANDLSNCVPACTSCNSQKWKFDFYDWYNDKNEKYDVKRLKIIHNWINGDYLEYKENQI